MESIAISILGVLFSISEILPLVRAVESNGILDMFLRLNRRIFEHLTSPSPEETALFCDGDSDHFIWHRRYDRSRSQPPPELGDNLV